MSYTAILVIVDCIPCNMLTCVRIADIWLLELIKNTVAEIECLQPQQQMVDTRYLKYLGSREHGQQKLGKMCAAGLVYQLTVNEHIVEQLKKSSTTCWGDVIKERTAGREAAKNVYEHVTGDTVDVCHGKSAGGTLQNVETGEWEDCRQGMQDILGNLTVPRSKHQTYTHR